MTQHVYKYPVTVGDTFTLEMPAGAKILSFQTQGLFPQIWALVDPSAPLMPRKFRLAWTGHPITSNIIAYIGTVQAERGALVFHLFEITMDSER